MKNPIRVIVTLLFFTALLPTSAFADEQKYSGFLGDYSKLTQEKDDTGETVLRYVNPELKPGDYNSVIIDAVQFYPAPKATEQVSEQTLNDIRNYVDNGFREKAEGKMTIATEPGPGVLRVRPAITAVASQSSGLKPYELLPIGFLISAAKGRDKVAAITIEFDAVDSVSGDRVGASVRKGAGAKLNSKDAQLTLEQLRPTLDKWIETGSSFMAENLDRGTRVTSLHSSSANPKHSLIACHECDLLQRETKLSVGRIETCRRCGAVLYKNSPDGLERALACLIGAAILFVVSSTFPIVSLDLQGRHTTATLLGTVHTLYRQDMALVAVLVLFTTLLMPALEIFAKLFMLIPLQLGFIPKGFSLVFRLMHSIRQWGMIDVFIIGILVSLVKLADLAVIVPGIAIWSFATMVILLAAATVFFDSHALWQKAASSQRRGNMAQHFKTLTAMSSELTALHAGIHICHACGQLNLASEKNHANKCHRCGSTVHGRKPDSINRSWALLIAAYILYIPANVLPIMQTSSLFGSQSDTILSGVIYLWNSGSWPIAAVIFIASIMVPLIKMLALTILLISVQRRSTWRPLDRTRLYRAVELVGKWSMVDVFVVAILVTLVQLESLATITAGPGAAAFGIVVVLTIFAAEAFDPRLIWDPVGDEQHG